VIPKERVSRRRGAGNAYKLLRGVNGIERVNGDIG
jgi:hypothetical protein